MKFVEFIYSILVLIPVIYVWLSAIKFKSFINPVTFLVLKDWALVIFFPRFLYLLFDLQQFDNQSDMELSLVLYAVYFGGIVISGFFFANEKKYILLYSRLPSFRDKYFDAVLNSKRVKLILIFGFTFFLLITMSPSRWGWLIDSRNAYQFGREGLGVLYAMLQLLLSILSFYAGINGYRSLRWLIIYMFLAFFLGSKSSIIYLLIIFYSAGIMSGSIRRSMLKEITGLIIVFFLILGLVYFMGDEGTTIDFRFSYFDHSVNLVNGFNALDGIHPEIWFSKLWEYVPRGLYSDKPFVYGDVYLTEILAPGMAAKGNTLGGPSYSAAALSFSYFGVFIFSFIQATFCNWLYRQSLMKNSHYALLCFINFSIVEVAKYFPLLIALLVLYLVAFYTSHRFSIFK